MNRINASEREKIAAQFEGDAARILIVDDEPVLCELMEEALKDFNYFVKKVYTVDDAIKTLENENYDLVITDWVMPVKSGLDLLNEIKRTHPRIGVIIVTAFATIGNAVLAMKKGASYYLPKPFSPEEVQIVVDKSLSELQTHQKLQDIELKYDTLLDNAPNAIVITDMNGCLTNFNKSAEQMTGYLGNNTST